MFKGADSGDNQKLRTDLLIYLKGTKQEKEKLKEEEPEKWASIEEVWSIRNRHMKTGLPSQYIKCCLSNSCSHPICSSHNTDVVDLPRAGQ